MRMRDTILDRRTAKIFFTAARFGIALLLCVSALVRSDAQEASAVKAVDSDSTATHWFAWSDDVFAQARAEHKYVLLDLEAVWCHWCHVMDAVTYADPDVRKELQEKYLAIKVDQDSRPDISNRYEDYGWPATVVFDGDGKEIVKRQGYLPPKPMLSMLQAIVDDPTPGPSVVAEQPIVYATTSRIAPAVLARVRRSYELQYDVKAGGWGFSHKYLDADSVEFAMVLAREGDARARQRVRDTLRLEQKIQDPVWGGAYQYSAGGDWDEPHFEKLISIQSQVMRIYALGYAQFHDAEYLKVAANVDQYVQGFLTSPEGAFYVSQDADLVEGEHGAEYFKLDDSARRAKGIPRVDKHLYARENGWMIASLADLYAVSGDEKYLKDAERAADWVLEHRALEGGGFRHDEHDVAGPYLGDTLAMGQAFLALYEVTADRKWLDHAEATVPFIAANFAAKDGVGYVTAKGQTDRVSHDLLERDENIALARFTNLLFQYTGEAQARDIAEQTMRYLVTPAIAERQLSGGELLAVHEMAHGPLHVAIVGPVENATARQLYDAALRALRNYERLEWLSSSSAGGKREDAAFPAVGQPAAFVCEDLHCGTPIYVASELTASIEKASRQAGALKASLISMASGKAGASK